MCEKTDGVPALKLGAIVMDCPKGMAGEMARFYSGLLHWELTHPAAEGTAAITSPEGMVIAFQEVDCYTVPVWPWKQGEQGQMLHFDVIFTDLEQAVRHAEECGAKHAQTQFFDDSRTMIDPAGHPFCLDTYHAE